MGIYSPAHLPTPLLSPGPVWSIWGEDDTVWEGDVSPSRKKFGSGGTPWRVGKSLLSLLQAEGAGKDRIGGIRVGLAELGTCNPSSVREPAVRDKDERARTRRKWKGKISWMRSGCAGFAATLKSMNHLPKPSLEARIRLQRHPEQRKSC